MCRHSANANHHVTLCNYSSNNNAAKQHSNCNIADNGQPLQSMLGLVLQKGNTIITWNTSPRKKKKRKKKTESAGSTPFQITMSEAELYSLMPFWGVFNRIREKGWKVWPGQQKQREKRRAMKTGVLYARYHVSLHRSSDWMAFPNTRLLASVQAVLKGAHTGGDVCVSVKGSNRGSACLSFSESHTGRKSRLLLPICPTAFSMHTHRVPWEQLWKYMQGRQTPAANPATLFDSRLHEWNILQNQHEEHSHVNHSSLEITE